MNVSRVTYFFSSTRGRLTLLVLLALGLRTSIIQVVGEARVPWEYEYEEIANQWAQSGRYLFSFYQLTSLRPTSFLPPVYPLTLGMARRWLGSWDDSAIQTLQVVSSSLMVLVTYALARELACSERVALWAAALMSCYPPLAVYSIELSTVTFETCGVLLGSFCLLHAARYNSVLSALGTGFFFAFAALTRPTWLISIPLAMLWLWQLSRELKWILPTLLTTTAILTLTPWLIYNYQTHGIWSVTSTNGGLNFWIGNNPQATGEYIFPTELDRDFVLSVADKPEFARDRLFYARGWEFVQTSPGMFLELLGRKLLYFLFFRPAIGSTYVGVKIPLTLARWVFVLSWLSVLPLALLGLFKTRPQWRLHSWLALLVISQALISACYFVGTRFRTPLDSFVLVWAALGLSWLMEHKPAFPKVHS
jgi:hypothetical protein